MKIKNKLIAIKFSDFISKLINIKINSTNKWTINNKSRLFFLRKSFNKIMTLNNFNSL